MTLADEASTQSRLRPQRTRACVGQTELDADILRARRRLASTSPQQAATTTLDRHVCGHRKLGRTPPEGDECEREDTLRSEAEFPPSLRTPTTAGNTTDVGRTRRSSPFVA